LLSSMRFWMLSMEQIGRPLQKGLDYIRATRPVQDPGISIAPRFDPVGNCLECKKSYPGKVILLGVQANPEYGEIQGPAMRECSGDVPGFPTPRASD
jgi:hypothetical protein